MSVLLARGVAKRYGRRAVLGPLDARLAPGELVVLTGANGAGKTTLLRLLASTLAPSAGSVAWDDALSGDRARRRVAYAGHEPLLYDELTALENLDLFVRIYAVPRPRQTAREALEHFGVAASADVRCAELSRGQRQRVALARAFALATPLLLLDEPTAALDAQGVGALRARLREGRASRATLVAAHDPAPYADLATHRWHLEAGRLAGAEAV